MAKHLYWSVNHHKRLNPVTEYDVYDLKVFMRELLEDYDKFSFLYLLKKYLNSDQPGDLKFTFIEDIKADEMTLARLRR
jgi:hypothetical protein